MQYIGGFLAGTEVPYSFNTRDSSGAPITFAGTPLLTVLLASDLSVIVANLAPTIDVNGVTGRHLALIDTSVAGFDAGLDFIIAVQQGTVEGQSVAGEQLARFSLNAAVLPDNSITAAAVSAGAVTKITDPVPTAVENADALLARAQVGGSNNQPTVSQALAGGLMLFTINTTTGVMTVLNGDGTTSYTRVLSRAQLNAIVSAT